MGIESGLRRYCNDPKIADLHLHREKGARDYESLRADTVNGFAWLFEILLSLDFAKDGRCCQNLG